VVANTLSFSAISLWIDIYIHEMINSRNK